MNKRDFDFIDELPAGHWKFDIRHCGPFEIVVAACPEHETRFYSGSKRIYWREPEDDRTVMGLA